MPWYWTDDLADALIRLGRLDPDGFRVVTNPIALRHAADTVEDAAVALQDDDEIPLAA